MFGILRVVGSFFVILIAISILVASTLASSVTVHTYSVFIKILLNHAQMMIIATTFKIEWPDFVKSVLD